MSFRLQHGYVRRKMRLLFEMDKKDHENCTHSFVRNSARAIIISDGKVAMVHSLKYDYYKFPGGGIEAGETPTDALVRETGEEAGLVVIPESIREYGVVHRVQRSDKDIAERFVQDNFYYFCKVREGVISQKLDDYEAEEAYRLEFVAPETAIEKNLCVKNSPYNSAMFEREANVLRLLASEGYF